MFAFTALLTAATFVLTSAQSIDPTTVPIQTRDQWCASQESVCPELCLQLNATSTTANTCDPTTLDFSCICGNGLSPNASEFTLTIPFFECQTFQNQCVAQCGHDNTCASACRQDNPCGAQVAVKNGTTTTTSASTTATGTSGSTSSATVFNGFGGSTTSAAAGAASTTGTSGSSGAVMVVDAGASYGLAVVLAGVFAGFALL